MSAKAQRMAYDAGRALPRVEWPDEIPVEQRQVGEHHCPFAEGDPQREAWLRGLRDSLSEQLDDKARAQLLKRIEDEVGAADHAG